MSVVSKSHKPGQLPITQADLDRHSEKLLHRYKHFGDEHEAFKGFECSMFPYGSTKAPTCPESCMICTEQYVPQSLRKDPFASKVLQIHDDALANANIQDLVQTTQTNYAYVRSRIQIHGNAIAKRWQKKTPTKREQTLLDALPDLLLKRNADMELIFELINYQLDSFRGQWTREAFMKKEQRPEHPLLVPFLNAESLSEDPMRLLALMHHRAHTHLSEWISFDREMIQQYFNSSALKPVYNPQCVIIHGSNQDFGSLVQWSKDAAHRWQMIGYPLALRLLQVQAKVSHFLHQLVVQLLDQSEEEAPKGRDAWDRLVSASFKHEEHFVAQSAYYSQNFAPPPKFDLDYIVSAVTVRCNAALDEAMLVQADPLYLRRLLRQVQSSAVYPFLDNEDKPKVLYWTSIQSMMHRNTWGFILGISKKLQAQTVQEQHGIIQLPVEYEEHLRILEAAVRVEFADLIHDLRRFVANSRAFQHHFRDGHQITDPEDAYRNDPLFWGLGELVAQNIQTNRPTAWCFSFIEEHLSKASPKENARIDQQLYDQLSDIAFADEILTAIKAHKSYSPFSKNSGEARLLYERHFKGAIAYAFCSALATGLEEPEVQRAFHIFLEAPLPRKESNVEKLALNNALNEKFREYWRILRAKCVFGPHLSHLEPEEMQWIKAKFAEYSGGRAHIFETKQNAIRGAIRKQEDRSKLANAAITNGNTTGSSINRSDINAHNTGRDIAKTLDTRPKIKTRPTPSTLIDVANGVQSIRITDSALSTSSSPPNIISVKAKTIGFFRQMFSSTEAPERSPKWVDLLDAMVDAGMSATHSVGSAVTFRNEKNKKRAIVLHKPHPDPTVDHVMLKTIGKRLTKWFGWTEGTFVERGKEGA